MRKALCLLAFSYSFLLLAQQPVRNTDSLLVALSRSHEDSAKVNVLNDLSHAYVEIDSAKGMVYARKALATAEKLQWREGISRAYFRIAIQYKFNSNYRKSLAYFNKSLAETNDKRQMSKIYDGIGSVHLYESNYSKALASYLRALKIDESLGDKKGIATTSVNIATVYYSIKDYRKSIAYFNKSLAQKTGGKHYLSILYRNLAAAYNGMGQKQKALEYFGKSLSLCEEMGDDAFKSNLLSDMALTYYDLKDYEKAIRYSKRALISMPKGMEDKVNTAFTFGIIGDSYTEKARLQGKNSVMLDSAMHYLGKSIALHKELESIRGLYDDYTSLTKAQKLRGDYEKALASYEKAIVYKDSIFNSENRETIKNLEDKRSIEIRDRELKISQITLEADKRQKWFLIVGIAFLAIIGILLFYQSNSRKKTNRKLNRMYGDLDRADRMKTRLLSILNHDLRSPVSSFLHFIQLQREAPGLLDTTTKKRIEDETIDSAKNLLESMEDMLLWTKDQMENFEPQYKNVAMGEVFDDLKRHFSDAGNVVLQFDNPENISIFTDENYVKTILRNLISNAIRVLENRSEASIIVSAQKQDSSYILTVSDNGPGGTAEQFSPLYDDKEISGIKSGLGLHLIRDLAKAVGCKISVDTKIGEGTVFRLSFP